MIFANLKYQSKRMIENIDFDFIPGYEIINGIDGENSHIDSGEKI